MEKGNAKDLLQRYLNGTCTPEEKALVESFYNLHNPNTQSLSEQELEKELGYLEKTLVSGRILWAWKPVFGRNTYQPSQNCNTCYCRICWRLPVPPQKKIVLKTIVITPAGRRSVVTRTVIENP